MTSRTIAISLLLLFHALMVSVSLLYSQHECLHQVNTLSAQPFLPVFSTSSTPLLAINGNCSGAFLDTTFLELADISFIAAATGSRFIKLLFCITFGKPWWHPPNVRKYLKPHCCRTIATRPINVQLFPISRKLHGQAHIPSSSRRAAINIPRSRDHFMVSAAFENNTFKGSSKLYMPPKAIRVQYPAN